jgi:hypothetical protein
MSNRPHRLIVRLLSISIFSAAISCGDVECPPGTHRDGAYCRRSGSAGTAAPIGGNGGTTPVPQLMAAGSAGVSAAIAGASAGSH